MEGDNYVEEPESESKVDRYDLIIEGTGIVESIVACAASRSGKSVLHLDSDDYYGCNSASFPLQDFLSWCRAATSQKQLVSVKTGGQGLLGQQDSTAPDECSSAEKPNDLSVLDFGGCTILAENGSLPSAGAEDSRTRVPSNNNDVDTIPSDGSSSSSKKIININGSNSLLRVIAFQDMGE